MRLSELWVKAADGKANLRLSLSIVNALQCRGCWSDEGDAVDADAVDADAVVKPPDVEGCLGSASCLQRRPGSKKVKVSCSR
jgi:hypothetical protein